jgi:hypothetical protein
MSASKGNDFMQVESKIQKPGSPVWRRVLIACLALALVVGGLTPAATASAAPTLSFSGTGTGKSKEFTLEKGLYQADFTWSGNETQWGDQGHAVGQIRSVKGYDVSEYFNSGYATSGKSRVLFQVKKAQKVYIDVPYLQDAAKWSAQVKKVSLPKTTKSSLSGSGTGVNVVGPIKLSKGFYDFRIKYSENDGNGSLNKTNFIAGVGLYNGYGGGLVNDIALKGDKKIKKVELTATGVVWFAVENADAGAKWTVTATKVGKKSLTKTPAPKITGTAKVGKTLKAKAGTWKPSKVKLSYQWYRGDKKIKKATKSTYKLTKSDKGKKIKVKVTGKKSGYKTVTKTSKATAKVK